MLAALTRHIPQIYLKIKYILQYSPYAISAFFGILSLASSSFRYRPAGDKVQFKSDTNIPRL